MGCRQMWRPDCKGIKVSKRGLDEVNLKLRQRQAPSISLHMLKRVTVLQMGSRELSVYLEQVEQENPVAELVWPDAWDALRDGGRRKDRSGMHGEDGEKEIRQEKSYDDYNQETLRECLMSQLIGGHYDKQEFCVFSFIADSLDGRGYFVDDIENVAAICGVRVEKAKQCLALMKTLDPAGVCASGLRESLEIQLERKGSLDDCSVELAIVREYLELLGKNRLPQIAENLHVSVGRVVRAKACIRSLNPRPANGYRCKEVIHYLRPDIIVTNRQKDFEVAVDGNAVPDLQMNKGYLRLLQNGGCDEETLRYINERAFQIEQIQNHIRKRNAMLVSIGRHLVEIQRDFFLYGEEFLRPLRMKEMAALMGVHESILSRGVKDKYLQCGWGLFPLNFFFPHSVYESENPENNTAGLVKRQMRIMIDAEDKKRPLSDQRLAERLKENGIHVSRRTVSKYREDMGIADSRGRKEFALTAKDILRA